jgi:hypothetical protein
VSPHASPSANQASTAIPSLHILDFLSCITSISHGQNLLPSAGLTRPLQARHVGNLIYYCFAALDIKENFTTCPFESSLLGSRLFTWLHLLDAPAVLFLWDRCPRHASYQWMLSCRSLLHIFQRWLAAIKWQQTRGFATVQDSSTLQYRVIVMVGLLPTCLIVSPRYSPRSSYGPIACWSTTISSGPAHPQPIYSIKLQLQPALTLLAQFQRPLLMTRHRGAIPMVPLTSVSAQISHALILQHLPASSL